MTHSNPGSAIAVPAPTSVHAAGIARPALLIALLAAILSGTSGAQQSFSYRFDFDQPGAFPSGDPVLTFLTNGPPEGTVYSVAGGLLQQRSTGLAANLSYHGGNGPGLPATPVSFSPTAETVIEARLKVNHVEPLGLGSAGAYIQAHDGVNRYFLTFHNTFVGALTSTGWMSFLVNTQQFRTYKMVSPANSPSFCLFVDGVKVMGPETAAALPGFDGFSWGDGDSTVGAGADVDWDHVRFSNGAVLNPACAGSNGLVPLQTIDTSTAVPSSGSPFTVNLSNAAAPVAFGVFLSLPGPSPFPVPLTSLGGPSGCLIKGSVGAPFPIFSFTGPVPSFTLAIPPNAVGFQFATEWLAADLGLALTLPVTTSDLLNHTIQ